MISPHTYDVLYIGNYTKDTIVTPAGTRYTDGGAVNYAAHAAARLGWKVAVVTRMSVEDQRVVDKWLQTGIDSFVTYTPQSTLMNLYYPTLDPDIRTLTVAATAGAISAADIQPLHARMAVIGSSLRGEVGLDVIRALRAQGHPGGGGYAGLCARARRMRPWFTSPGQRWLSTWPRSTS